MADWNTLTTDQKLDEMRFSQLAIGATAGGLALLALGFALYRSSKHEDEERRLSNIEGELHRLTTQGEDLTAIAQLDRLALEAGRPMCSPYRSMAMLSAASKAHKSVPSALSMVPYNFRRLAASQGKVLPLDVTDVDILNVWDEFERGGIEDSDNEVIDALIEGYRA